MKAGAPDWWGEIPRVNIGLTEDRYVTALEVKEVNNVDNRAAPGRQTVGGHYVFHHMIWSTRVIVRLKKRIATRTRSIPTAAPAGPCTK